MMIQPVWAETLVKVNNLTGRSSPENIYRWLLFNGRFLYHKRLSGIR